MGMVGMKVLVLRWILVMGGFGIVIGVVIYGYCVMEIVGKKIIEFINMCGFIIDFLVVIVVFVVSWFGFLILMIYVVVGVVIGVGFVRGVKVINKDIVRDIIILWFVMVFVVVLISVFLFKILMIVG